MTRKKGFLVFLSGMVAVLSSGCSGRVPWVSAAGETREYAEDLKATIHRVEPEISDVLVPNCIYRCGCPEMNGCGLFARMLKADPDIGSHDIQRRYDAYNRLFWAERGQGK